MRLTLLAATCAAVGAFIAMAPVAEAQSRRNDTVVVTRGEDGRTRTRVIIEKRSYLDPGKEVLPGSRRDADYATFNNERATSVLDNTGAGSNQTALPGRFELGPRGPYLNF